MAIREATELLTTSSQIPIGKERAHRTQLLNQDPKWRELNARLREAMQQGTNLEDLTPRIAERWQDYMTIPNPTLLLRATQTAHKG